MQDKRKGKYIRRTLYTLAGVLFFILVFTIFFKVMVKIDPPSVPEISAEKFTEFLSIPMHIKSAITGLEKVKPAYGKCTFPETLMSLVSKTES